MRARIAELGREAEAADVASNAEAIRADCKTFAGFVRKAWHVIEPGTPLKWNWHLDAMCDHLEAITWGRMTPWLIINVPPGSSKSTIVSVLWQAWEWGPCGLRHLRYVSTSFEEGNVTRDTRKCRDLIRSEWYQALWPDVGALTRAGETSFANRDTGSREGVAFGSITGKRGDRVIIDDPHSLKGAESEAERNNATRLFLEGGLNRSNDAQTSAMVIVMQRLHQDDLTGVLLARKLGFVHLMIPMEFEPARRFRTPLDWTDPRSYDGELMDPVRMPREAIDRQKKAGDYSWNGQYQQRPAPREGGLFKVERIERIAASPGGGKAARGWDLAGTTRKTSAFTAGVKLRVATSSRVIIEDVKRDRLGPYEVKLLVRNTATDDGIEVKQSIPQDPGQAGVAQRQDMGAFLEGHNYRFSPETGDKQTRALPIASAIEAGLVDMVIADWNAEFIEELRGFPTASYKDQVDALSRAYSELVAARQTENNAAPILIDNRAGEDYQASSFEDPWLAELNR